MNYTRFTLQKMRLHEKMQRPKWGGGDLPPPSNPPLPNDDNQLLKNTYWAISEVATADKRTEKRRTRSQHVNRVRRVTAGDCPQTLQHFAILVGLEPSVGDFMKPPYVQLLRPCKEIVEVMTGATWRLKQRHHRHRLHSYVNTTINPRREWFSTEAPRNLRAPWAPARGSSGGQWQYIYNGIEIVENLW